MPTIIRTTKKRTEHKFPAYGGRLNLWAYKTKRMTEEEQEQLVEDNPEQFPDEIRVIVIAMPDPNDAGHLDMNVARTLVDAIVPLSAFDTGSIGYTLEIKGATFEDGAWPT